MSDVMAERAMGRHLAALAAAKGRGWDFSCHSSWCSEQSVFVLRLRRPTEEAHAARTKVGPIEEVLRWGAGEVER